VFVSHTSELRDFPADRPYLAAAERAISACGHVIVDMADFPAADQPAAELCRERVRGCDVYVGVLGTRYGSPVRVGPLLGEVVLAGVADGGGPVRGAGLGEDVVDVALDGVSAQVQVAGDVGVGPPSGDHG
jgi:Domain of unknown function (DUF4062)